MTLLEELPAGEFVDITSFGAAQQPEALLVRSGFDKAISEARARYVEGSINADQFELEVDHICQLALQGMNLLADRYGEPFIGGYANPDYIAPREEERA